MVFAGHCDLELLHQGLYLSVGGIFHILMANVTAGAFFQKALLTHVVTVVAHPDFRMEELFTRTTPKTLLDLRGELYKFISRLLHSVRPV